MTYQLDYMAAVWLAAQDVLDSDDEYLLREFIFLLAFLIFLLLHKITHQNLRHPHHRCHCQSHFLIPIQTHQNRRLLKEMKKKIISSIFQ